MHPGSMACASPAPPCVRPQPGPASCFDQAPLAWCPAQHLNPASANRSWSGAPREPPAQCPPPHEVQSSPVRHAGKPLQASPRSMHLDPHAWRLYRPRLDLCTLSRANSPKSKYGGVLVGDPDTSPSPSPAPLRRKATPKSPGSLFSTDQERLLHLRYCISSPIFWTIQMRKVYQFIIILQAYSSLASLCQEKHVFPNDRGNLIDR